ncbi:MAG: RNA polymerase sigma factor [Myxococcaceae bacterium]
MIPSSLTAAESSVSAPASAEEQVRQLYREHAQALHRALRRLAAPGIDAADLLQDVFVVALRRGIPAHTASPRAWLFGVALKVAADSRRSARLRRFFGLESIREVAADGAPDADVLRSETAQQVHRALDRLSREKREVLVLFEMEGMSGGEIAEIVGCPINTVWTRLHHARRDLERALSAEVHRP